MKHALAAYSCLLLSQTAQLAGVKPLRLCAWNITVNQSPPGCQVYAAPKLEAKRGDLSHTRLPEEKTLSSCLMAGSGGPSCAASWVPMAMSATPLIAFFAHCQLAMSIGDQMVLEYWAFPKRSIHATLRACIKPRTAPLQVLLINGPFRSELTLCQSCLLGEWGGVYLGGVFFRAPSNVWNERQHQHAMAQLSSTGQIMQLSDFGCTGC